jgi:hypothetical protein
VNRPACEILHDLACELDRFLDRCAALHVHAPTELEALLNEAKAHKPTHIPAEHAFDQKNNERKDEL